VGGGWGWRGGARVDERPPPPRGGGEAGEVVGRRERHRGRPRSAGDALLLLPLLSSLLLLPGSR